MTKFNNLSTNQENLEKMVSKQNTWISEILTILKDHKKMHPEFETKGKEKSKIKVVDKFYKVNINYLY